MKNIAILIFSVLTLFGSSLADAAPISVCSKSTDPIDSLSLPCQFPNMHAGPYAGSINIKKDRETMSFRLRNNGEISVSLRVSYAENCTTQQHDEPTLTEDFFSIKPGQTQVVTVYSNCTYNMAKRDWPQFANEFGSINISVLTWAGADWSKINATLDNA